MDEQQNQEDEPGQPERERPACREDREHTPTLPAGQDRVAVRPGNGGKDDVQHGCAHQQATTSAITWRQGRIGVPAICCTKPGTPTVMPPHVKGGSPSRCETHCVACRVERLEA